MAAEWLPDGDKDTRPDFKCKSMFGYPTGLRPRGGRRPQKMKKRGRTAPPRQTKTTKAQESVPSQTLTDQLINIELWHTLLLSDHERDSRLYVEGVRSFTRTLQRAQMAAALIGVYDGLVRM